jgi:hypothetical protein
VTRVDLAPGTVIHPSITPESLHDDYVRDLEADLAHAEATGATEYAATVRKELAALRAASHVRIGRYGVPEPVPTTTDDEPGRTP